MTEAERTLPDQTPELRLPDKVKPPPGRTERDQVEEADLESFPASDPPPGPGTIAPDAERKY